MFGYSRQAYYKSQKKKEMIEEKELLDYLFNRRKLLPFEGLRKLYVNTIRETELNVSRYHLQQILEENQLNINKKRPFRVLTDSSKSKHIHENYLRKRTPHHIFEVLVSDITYLRTRHREYYLTAIMDLYARMILSYSMTESLGAEGLLRAFMLITRQYKERLKGCIFHSDRGSQFCSTEFKILADKYGVVLSNSRKGNPYDNACIERLFATLKNEYMLRITFSDEYTLFRAVKEAVYNYNNIRLHMSLNYMTPKEYFLADLKSY
jgi:transposase InsO family protein